MEKGKAKADKYGLMEPTMMVFGVMIWPMEKESLDSMMEVSMKEIFETIGSMESASLPLQIKILFMKDNSTNIFSMDMALKYLCRKSMNILEILRTMLSRVMGALCTKMAAVTMDYGAMANLMAKDITSVRQWSTKADGNKINCMDTVSQYGKMEEDMKGIM